MEINGKVIGILPPFTFNTKNGEQKKYGFVIETNGNYPQKVCIHCFGDERWGKLGIVVGCEYNFNIEVSSREYNERWFTEVTCWRAIPIGNQRQMANKVQKEPQEQNASTTQATQKETIITGNTDLPF